MRHHKPCIDLSDTGVSKLFSFPCVFATGGAFSHYETLRLVNVHDIQAFAYPMDVFRRNHSSCERILRAAIPGIGDIVSWCAT